MLAKTIRKMMFNRPFYDKLEFTIFCFCPIMQKMPEIGFRFFLFFFSLMGFLCEEFSQAGVSAFW
jgi:hypothetical protein